MSGESGRTAEETQRELAKELAKAKERATANGQTGRSQ